MNAMTIGNDKREETGMPTWMKNMQKFLRPDTNITFCGEFPVDMNDRENERTAVEFSLPAGFSKRAQRFWDYLDGTAFLYSYKGHLVVTDESLYLTFTNDDIHEVPFGGPRWVCDSWEELEHNLEDAWNELLEDGLL